MVEMWISWNNSCRNTMTDVICHPNKLLKKTSRDSYEVDRHGHDEVRNSSKVLKNIISYKQTVPPCSFKEIGVGDPSRTVIEKILRDALTYQTKKISKIRKVYRVKNSPEVIETFEKYRRTVKQKAKETEHKQPRSLVDGNELLGFYAISMTCYSRKSELVSGPCKQSDCNLCQTINSSFDVKNDKRSGIQLSMSSVALSESLAAILNGKYSKKAVIICRIIAGRIRTARGGTNEDEYDSIRNYKRFCLTSENLIVKNSNAVLPCFVIVLN